MPKETVRIILTVRKKAMSDVAKHIFFSGQVQGVGFRFTANSIARRYELTGFVRNTADGKVEIFLQGAEEDIDDCIEDLQQTFTVRDVHIEQIEPNPSYEDFRITF
ncbi:MAG: acylphosphatase [Phycisphaerae bacterium]